MKFKVEHQGKWVAAKGEEIIADADSLKKLIKKVSKNTGSQNLKFSLVPKGFIAGY